MLSLRLIIFGGSFLSCFQFVLNYRVLAIITTISHSHFLSLERILSELTERGHQVTVFSNHAEKLKSPNFVAIDGTSCSTKGLPDTVQDELLTGFVPVFIDDLEHFYDNLLVSECYLKLNSYQELIKSNQSFDVVMVEYFNFRLFTELGYIFKAPVIHYSSLIPPPWVAWDYGYPLDPSYIPNFLGSVGSTKMNFFERLRNTVEVAIMVLVDQLMMSGKTQELVNQYAGTEIPPMEELMRGSSLLLVNTHHTVSGVRPVVPNVVEIGGVHIKEAKKLPQNIEKFINESKHGVVYFCMGSLLRGETFPPEKREAFLYAFSKIPQRVLWKWEGDVLPGKSDNIMISKWMPQRDILAHPNVKLFISHGGLLGTSEAVYEGVPVLGIPIFGDQRTNIKSLEANGAGELLDYNEISKEVVLEKIQRLLNDPKYKENAKLLSDRYRDRPMSPLDTAVYWTEYVIRHKGAPHLRTAAADMPWYQYLLLDVIAFIVAVLVAGLLIIYYTTKFILRAIYGLICGGGAKKGSSKSDKKKRN
ncbi:UDP-glycosyltransferase UGT5-like isoform X14 [Planococcus citri]|uniref:UDP-glycosyltransferase UGT5-like isoform X14 n=1 Tax=Planococcus citri TaxID=170843 RepID=UPI0031FA116E